MKLLAIDTSTETMSVAVQYGEHVLNREVAGGAQSSVTAMALIQELMARLDLKFSQLDALVWGRGPGSFTGVRTACALVQGLAYAHKTPVLGVDTLAACAQVAVSVRSQYEGVVVAALDARMGEIYVARYAWHQWQQKSTGKFDLMKPEQLRLEPGILLCGNAARVYAVLGNQADQGVLIEHSQPLAGALLELAPNLIRQGCAGAAHEAQPLYIRDKVALTTAERDLAKRLG